MPTGLFYDCPWVIIKMFRSLWSSIKFSKMVCLRKLAKTCSSREGKLDLRKLTLVGEMVSQGMPFFFGRKEIHYIWNFAMTWYCLSMYFHVSYYEKSCNHLVSSKLKVNNKDSTTRSFRSLAPFWCLYC